MENMSTAAGSASTTPPGPVPRAVLADIPAYVPKPPKPASDGPSYRLFLNENPCPPLASV
jgi:histidinol-phosphate aminotransferase